MPHQISLDAYLIHERASLGSRNEYIEGYLIPVDVGTTQHGKMITNIARLLGGCRT
ncbi:hypothetical protein [Endozoicomonas ascidiicola]|uniref:hypothetical protein n=1 Tax=Endozoicomonas ascidiicola TaxID=1698521 RepID=UPI000A4AE3BD|nr:hypothetical protein [Endozoicomonas ascidiicola]